MEDKKYQETVDIAVSKIHWGETEDQVRHWLAEERGLPPLMVDSILKKALSKRAAAIRGKALVVLIVCGIGIVVAGGFLYLEFRSNFIEIYRTLGAIFIFCICLLGAARALWRLLSGRVVGAVE